MSESALRTRAEFERQLTQHSQGPNVVEEIDIRGVNLTRRALTGWTFRRVAMEQALLQETRLSRLHLAECGLRGATLSQSHLKGCTLFHVEALECSFRGADLQDVQFNDCRLSNVDFSAARLMGTTFMACELFGSRWESSFLSQVNFDAEERGNVTLDRADFSGSVLVNVDFMGANLFGACFDNAILVGVDLRRANLAGARFDGAHFIDVMWTDDDLEPGLQRAMSAANDGELSARSERLRTLLAAREQRNLTRLTEALLLGDASSRYGRCPSSFADLITDLQGVHDFPELSRLRVSEGRVEVQCEQHWYPISAHVVEATSPELSAARLSSGGPPLPSQELESSATPTGAGSPGPASEPVPRSKRFENLELD